jgi:hypothetical protein
MGVPRAVAQPPTPVRIEPIHRAASMFEHGTPIGPGP